jgi:hypothetical protein
MCLHESIKGGDDEFVRIVLTNREKIAYEKVRRASKEGNPVIVLIY